METVNNVQSKTKTTCESFLVHLFSLPSSSRAHTRTARGQNPNHSQTVSAFQVVARTILNAKEEVRTRLMALVGAFSNTRMYVGILLIFGARLVSSCYLLFDQHLSEYQTFWNAYNFLFTISGEIRDIVCYTGVFLLFGPHNKARCAVLIPLVYSFARPFYLLSIPTDDLVKANEMVGQFPQWYWLLLAIPVAIFWIKTFNWMMARHYHKTLGIVARIVNLMRTPGIDNDQRVELARKEADEYVSLINR